MLNTETFCELYNLPLKTASQHLKDARSMKNGIGVKLLTAATVKRRWRILVMTVWSSAALFTLRFNFLAVHEPVSMHFSSFLTCALKNLQYCKFPITLNPNTSEEVTFCWSSFFLTCYYVCVCLYMHLAALEVAALALLRSTESARRSHGRLSGADS